MTAVEWFAKQVLRSRQLGFISNEKFNELLEQAKEMEKEQMLNALSISAKEAYRAGQKTMYCGCYDIEDATTFEEWIIKYKLNKSE